MMKAMRVPGALLLGLALWAPGAAALDLATVLQEVAASNPELAAREAMVDAARLRVRPAGAWNSPMVEIGLVNVPQSGRFDQDPMTMRMVGVTQRVPLSGANGLTRRAAWADVAAQVSAGEMARYQMLGMALESFAAARYAQERSRQAEGHQGVMGRLVESARARYQAGRGRLEDVLRSEAERARLTADVARYRAETASALARLAALRGATPVTRDTLAPLALAAVTATPEAWLAAVDRGHPRVEEMAARIESYRLGARSARRTAWPDLELRGSYGNRDAVVSPHGTAPQDDMFSVSVGFMLPLFAPQHELAEGRVMEAMARASEAEKRGVELELRREVTAAWAEAGAAERVVGLLADTVLAAQRQAVEAAWASYGAGSSDLWRVFESTHALYDQEIALLVAREDLARAQARLLAVTGRGDLLGLTLPNPGGTR